MSHSTDSVLLLSALIALCFFLKSGAILNLSPPSTGSAGRLRRKTRLSAHTLSEQPRESFCHPGAEPATAGPRLMTATL